MPSSSHARMTRIAISPRLATRIFVNMGAGSVVPLGRGADRMRVLAFRSRGLRLTGIRNSLHCSADGELRHQRTLTRVMQFPNPTTQSETREPNVRLRALFE